MMISNLVMNSFHMCCDMISVRSMKVTLWTFLIPNLVMDRFDMYSKVPIF